MSGPSRCAPSSATPVNGTDSVKINVGQIFRLLSPDTEVRSVNLAVKYRSRVQSYQNQVVKAVVDCFDGQPLQTGLGYRIDPGRVAAGQQARLEMDSGFMNSVQLFPPEAILKNIRAAQVRQNLPVSDALKLTNVSPVNLDIEMEAGTGKAYCYIKTIFELNKNTDGASS